MSVLGPPVLRYKVLVLAVLTVQNTSLVLVTKLSFRPTAVQYVVSTVVASAELLKLMMSFALLFISDGKHAAYQAIHEIPTCVIRLMVPSVSYVLQNNLLFLGVRLLTPTQYMVCSQSKILTSALWSGVLLGTHITRKQCAALFLLICGMIMVQGDEQLHGQAGSAVHISNAGSTVYGTVIVFVAALISGFAGAYLEKLYRVSGAKKQSVWFRNTQLAFLSLPIATIAACWQDGEYLWKHGIFRGYDGIVFTIVLLQAAGGLIVAAVLRYAGNVLKCFAVCFSICNCAVASAYLHDENVSPITALGIVLVTGSTFLYSSVK